MFELQSWMSRCYDSRTCLSSHLFFFFTENESSLKRHALMKNRRKCHIIRPYSHLIGGLYRHVISHKGGHSKQVLLYIHTKGSYSTLCTADRFLMEPRRLRIWSVYAVTFNVLSPAPATRATCIVAGAGQSLLMQLA